MDWLKETRKEQASIIDEMIEIERAAYQRGMIQMAWAFHELTSVEAPMKVIHSLAELVAKCTSIEATDTPAHCLEISCRRFRYFDLFEAPKWIEEEEIGVDGKPILPAYETRDGIYYKVWCRYCFKWHTHGAGEGHRGAHCHDGESPYDKTGYVLRRVGKFPKE